VFGFQRIAARDDPPDGIEAQAAHGRFGDVEVSTMGGIEAAAEETDAAAGGGAGQTRALQGRTCPVPRTAYL
jgi:hypothetical protein